MPVRKSDLLAALWLNPEAAVVSFLSAMAMGIVTPLLYYLIVLPNSIWLGLLVALDCASRIAGGRALRRFELRVGYARAISIAQTAAALAYIIMAAVGLPGVGPVVAFGFIYLARSITSAASAGYPSVLGLTHRTGDWTRLSVITTGLGFAAGCALLATFADHTQIEHSMVHTGRLVNPAEAAAIVSALAVVIAWRMPERERIKGATDSLLVGQRPGRYVLTAVAGEAAFGMTIVAAPLLQRETYLYVPVLMAIFFAYLAALSVTVEFVLPSQLRTRLAARTAMLMGMGMSAIGFFGFAAALQFSWATSFDGMRTGRWALWAAGLFVGLGHGLLRASLPVRLDKEFEGLGTAQGFIRLDDLGEIVRGVAALFAGAIWAAHERSSMAIPGALALAALAWGIWPVKGWKAASEGVAIGI